MSKAVGIFSGILFVRTRYYDDVKKVVVLQGNKPERRFFEEKPQGEWITRHKQNKLGQDVVCFECNKCGEYKVPLYHLLITEPLKACPNCGAKMRKPNCVRCDHFGDCDGCERSGEE